jgi:hypothetical protein
MAAGFASSSTSWLDTLGQFRWLRTHISTFCLGAVLLACANLLIGGSDLWSLTAIGIWIMLLLVHVILLAIARLARELVAEDEEEIVLLPIQDALIVEPKPDPAATWTTSESTATKPHGSMPNGPAAETVPWSVATDVAQVRRPVSGEPPE